MGPAPADARAGATPSMALSKASSLGAQSTPRACRHGLQQEYSSPAESLRDPHNQIHFLR